MHIRNLTHFLFYFLRLVLIFRVSPRKELQKLEKRINNRRPSNERVRLGERLFHRKKQDHSQYTFAQRRHTTTDYCLRLVTCSCCWWKTWVRVVQLCTTFSELF